MLASMLMLVCAIGFAQPGSMIDERSNFIITKGMTVDNSGTTDKLTFRRVLCEDSTQDLETINIISPKLAGEQAKPVQLKLMVAGESFSLEPCSTIYSVAEANTTPVEGYSFVVPKEVQSLILNNRDSVSLSYGFEGIMLTYVPNNEEKQDLGFMHIWSYKSAGIKKK